MKLSVGHSLHLDLLPVGEGACDTDMVTATGPFEKVLARGLVSLQGFASTRLGGLLMLHRGVGQVLLGLGLRVLGIRLG